MTNYFLDMARKYALQEFGDWIMPAYEAGSDRDDIECDILDANPKLLCPNAEEELFKCRDLLDHVFCFPLDAYRSGCQDFKNSRKVSKLANIIFRFYCNFFTADLIDALAMDEDNYPLKTIIEKTYVELSESDYDELLKRHAQINLKSEWPIINDESCQFAVLEQQMVHGRRIALLLNQKCTGKEKYIIAIGFNTQDMEWAFNSFV